MLLDYTDTNMIDEHFNICDINYEYNCILESVARLIYDIRYGDYSFDSVKSLLDDLQVLLDKKVAFTDALSKNNITRCKVYKRNLFKYIEEEVQFTNFELYNINRKTYEIPNIQNLGAPYLDVTKLIKKNWDKMPVNTDMINGLLLMKTEKVKFDKLEGVLTRYLSKNPFKFAATFDRVDGKKAKDAISNICDNIIDTNAMKMYVKECKNEFQIIKYDLSTIENSGKSQIGLSNKLKDIVEKINQIFGVQNAVFNSIMSVINIKNKVLFNNLDIALRTISTKPISIPNGDIITESFELNDLFKPTALIQCESLLTYGLNENKFKDMMIDLTNDRLSVLYTILNRLDQNIDLFRKKINTLSKYGDTVGYIIPVDFDFLRTPINTMKMDSLQSKKIQNVVKTTYCKYMTPVILGDYLKQNNISTGDLMNICNVLTNDLLYVGRQCRDIINNCDFTVLDTGKIKPESSFITYKMVLDNMKARIEDIIMNDDGLNRYYDNLIGCLGNDMEAYPIYLLNKATDSENARILTTLVSNYSANYSDFIQRFGNLGDLAYIDDVKCSELMDVNIIKLFTVLQLKMTLMYNLVVI